MRLYVKISENKEIIPFNYQHLLTGVVHKWIGEKNSEHGKPSLYCFSWLQNTVSFKNGINIKPNSYFFISTYEPDLLKKIMRGILAKPEMFCGSEAIDIQIKNAPVFSFQERFILNSPILIRKRDGDNIKHITYLDKDFDSLLTENLKSKLAMVNIPNKDVSIELDKNYSNPQTKLINYKGIMNKTTLAPVIIKGTPEQVKFAWQVGLGNSTGIGFGSIK